MPTRDAVDTSQRSSAALAILEALDTSVWSKATKVNSVIHEKLGIT